MGRKRIRIRNVPLGAYVVERLAYVDSMFVRTTRKLDPEDFELLRQTLPLDVRFSERRLLSQRWEYINGETGEVRHHHVLVIHQPMKDTCRLLAELATQNPNLLHLLEIHLALDLVTHSSVDVESLYRHILATFTPARLPTSDQTQEFDTTYIGLQTGGNRIVIYRDGVRKVRPDSPRVHLEWRIHGAKALQRAKVRSIEDLLRFDHKAFWAQKLRFHVMPDLPRLGKVLERRAVRAGKFLSPEGRARLNEAIFRVSHDHRDWLSAQRLDSLLVSGLHPRPAQLYKRIPNAWALPEPGNVLWDEG